MLYRIGTKKELSSSGLKLPTKVRTEVFVGVSILDCEYGEDRNYLESGGFSLIAEAPEDIPAIKNYVDYEKHPCEWTTRIGNTGYISSLFVLNNDFSIIVYMPQEIAPQILLNELED